MHCSPGIGLSGLALRYRRRFADRGLAHWGLADRSLTRLGLLVLRARQICSLPSEVPVTIYQEFQHEHSPYSRGTKLESTSSLLNVPRQLTGDNQQDRNRFSALVWPKYHAEAVPAMLRVRSFTWPWRGAPISRAISAWMRALLSMLMWETLESSACPRQLSTTLPSCVIGT